MQAAIWLIGGCAAALLIYYIYVLIRGDEQ